MRYFNIFKKLLFLPAVLTIVLFLFIGIIPTYAASQTGSITICKAIIDQNDNVTDGSQVKGATFGISGFTPSIHTIDGTPAGSLPNASFTTPLTLNTKVFTDSVGNDSQCIKYNGLSFGAYYYNQESLPKSGWESPKYNDQFSSTVSKVNDVFSYDGRLFATDQSDVANRNQNADGSIVIDASRPDRTLVVVNKIANIPTPTQSLSDNKRGDNNGPAANNATAPVCSSTAPSGAPAITNVVYGVNSVTLTWTKASNPVSYYLVAYGTEPGKYNFGNPNVGGPDTTSYTINGLSSGVTYYFAVRAGNGCMPGQFSNEGSASNLSGDVLNSPASGFTPNVLGSENMSTSSGRAEGISTEVKNICASCFWWPVLLGEAVVLLLYYFLVRRRPLKINRVFVGAVVALLAYVVFLLINKGHVCPLGGINLYFFSIPCKYFWAIDGVVYVLLTWFTKKSALINVVPAKNTKITTSKKS